MCIHVSTRPQNMRRAVHLAVTITTLYLGLLPNQQAFGQLMAVLPQSGSGHPDATTCVILQRLGTVDEVTSRVLSFGIHGNRFQYVEGKLPKGISFQDKLAERDVSKLQARGSEIVIVGSDLMPDELQQARNYCLAETRIPPVQGSTTQIEVASTPPGSDIDIDGKFIGSTPSTVRLALGEHTIKLSKNGYTTWQRTMTAVAGSVRISPELEPVLPTQDASGKIPASLLTAADQPF